MILICHESTLMPKLAWYAVAQKDLSEIHVYHDKNML